MAEKQLRGAVQLCQDRGRGNMTEEPKWPADSNLPSKEDPSPTDQTLYAAARPVVGELVVVLRGKRNERGLVLIPQISRALRTGDIHELITTGESAEPGGTLDRICYLGFCEIDTGGLVRRGDRVRLGNDLEGRVLGFDATHFPNHYNIVVWMASPRDGKESELQLGLPVVFGGAESDLM